MSNGLRGADNRKPRSDAKLKNLPGARQAEIANYAATHSLLETLEWLRASGFQTSSGALSGFLSWYLLVQRLDAHRETNAQSAKETIKLIIRLNTNPEAQKIISGTGSEDAKTEKIMEIFFPKERAER